MGCQLSSTVSQQLLWELPVLDLGSLAPIALFLEAQQPPPSGQTIHSTPSASQGLPEPWDWFGPVVCSELASTDCHHAIKVWFDLAQLTSSDSPCWALQAVPTPMPQGLLTCLLCPQFSLFLCWPLAQWETGDESAGPTASSGSSGHSFPCPASSAA